MVSWILLTLFSLLAVALWWLAFAVWRKEPVATPRPHDPRVFLKEYARRWGPAPKPLHAWLGGSGERVDSTAGVVIAEVRARRAGWSREEDGTLEGRLDLHLPGDGGGTTTVHAIVEHAENAAAGTYLPVRAIDPARRSRDTYALVTNLAADDTSRLLTAHRQQLGLVTKAAARILTSGTYQEMRLIEIHPTGRVLEGHVEVVAVLAEEPGDGTRGVPGFLRPVALSAARRSGTLPVTRSESGEYALGPSGY